MLRIRLLRKGRKGQPFFLIVAIDSRRSPKSEKFLKSFGYYNPIEKNRDNRVKINDISEINNFISKGAQPSLTVKNILKKFQNS